MHGLRQLNEDALLFDTLFAFTNRVSVEIAPPGCPLTADLGRFDCLSGGAIINSSLHVLSRLPGVSGTPASLNPSPATCQT
jgi:hypothetical protein